MDAHNEHTPYQHLTPDTILNAVEEVGFRCTGTLLALNSYENRVYHIGIEEAPPLVAKFYRSGRWSSEAIREEHQFCLALHEQELPIIAPLVDSHGQTLFTHQGYRFALYPRQGGRPAELDNLEHLEQLGRLLGRLHAIGSVQPYCHRLTLSVATWGDPSVQHILQSNLLPPGMHREYQQVSSSLLHTLQKLFQAVGPYKRLRLHGDCHVGNLLWNNNAPLLLDFDDSCSGPAIQDLWMSLSGDHYEQSTQLSYLLRGYQTFFSFDRRELALIEPLRSLRLLHHAAWIARRWNDPAFPIAFPWFNAPRYWEEHIHSLQEQLHLLQNPQQTACLDLFY
ncbi:serine/threonine protein kinase [Candidatus Magnetaquicoccus inordinatus]|uniref:serine/threonine protein kinase n=1 Tax=Candidatus Magnetaquicoccus inordinatus TaxID=2496818 RepID=UPI00102AAEA4|nr:serine/threonine protein kinase [Candidatus Magnetaquicoccus inordinatus]